MARKELAQMTQAEVQKLSQAQLNRFNNPLPEHDYENPYDPAANPYPKWLYGPNEEGTDLISIKVDSKEEEVELVGDWRDTPSDWGIVTHPAAPRYERGSEFKVALPADVVQQLAEKRAQAKAAAIASATKKKKQKEPKPERVENETTGAATQ
jgi:hypothetical protein